jgi:hypothetical protein
LILKLDSDGAVTWQKTYGGTDGEFAYSIRQTTDGGYIVSGYTHSFGAGGRDIWILKLDSAGAVTWQKTYGGTNIDEFLGNIQQTSDGGYIIPGFTLSFGGPDAWILKLDSIGAVTWQKTYGGSYTEKARSIRQTADGGYIVLGYTFSPSTGVHSDLWILKLDSVGVVTWQKTYGGAGNEFPRSIQLTTDGGYIVA